MAKPTDGTTSKTGGEEEKSRRGGPRAGAGRKPNPARTLLNEAKLKAKADAESRELAGVKGQAALIEAKSMHLYQIAECEMWIGQHLRELFDLMLMACRGVAVTGTNPDGTPIYASTPVPDVAAIKYLLDRYMGKATDRAEMMPKENADAPAAQTEGDMLAVLAQKIYSMMASAMQPAATPAHSPAAPAQIEAPTSEAAH